MGTKSGGGAWCDGMRRAPVNNGVGTEQSFGSGWWWNASLGREGNDYAGVYRNCALPKKKSTKIDRPPGGRSTACPPPPLPYTTRPYPPPPGAWSRSSGLKTRSHRRWVAAGSSTSVCALLECSQKSQTRPDGWTRGAGGPTNGTGCSIRIYPGGECPATGNRHPRVEVRGPSGRGDGGPRGRDRPPGPHPALGPRTRGDTEVVRGGFGGDRRTFVRKGYG